MTKIELEDNLEHLLKCLRALDVWGDAEVVLCDPLQICDKAYGVASNVEGARGKVYLLSASAALDRGKEELK